MISKHYNRSLLEVAKHDKTIKIIQRSYQFPNMRKAVVEYIKQCTTCIQNKPVRHKPYTKQQQIKVPQ